VSKRKPIPYIEHYGSWSKAVHYKGNRMPFGTQFLTNWESELILIIFLYFLFRLKPHNDTAGKLYSTLRSVSRHRWAIQGDKGSYPHKLGCSFHCLYQVETTSHRNTGSGLSRVTVVDDTNCKTMSITATNDHMTAGKRKP
jgi:hypothetical protein